MTQYATGTQIAAFMRELAAIHDAAELARREYRYGTPEWAPLYRRSVAAQGIGYGIETARAWPSLISRLVDLGAAQVVEHVVASAPDTIAGAWDACKVLDR
jgi:hypothetical protein